MTDRLNWEEPAPEGWLLSWLTDQENDMHGYRTNEDGTETLAWRVREDGVVVCIHDTEHVCDLCVEADERIGRLMAGEPIDLADPDYDGPWDGRQVNA